MTRKKRIIHPKIPRKRRKRAEVLAEDVARAERRRLIAMARAQGLAPIDKPRLFSRSLIGSFGVRTFAGCFYQNHEFTCRDCGAKQVWTGRQQKWWYEGCQGQVYSTAIRCRACRLNERIRDGRAQPALGQIATQQKRVKA